MASNLRTTELLAISPIREDALHGCLLRVPVANFVVASSPGTAVAIRYVKGMRAPIVVAKGAGLLAHRIRDIAKKHGIVLVERHAVACLLYRAVQVGQEIPPFSYASVIEIMRYIRTLRGPDFFNAKTLQEGESR